MFYVKHNLTHLDVIPISYSGMCRVDADGGVASKDIKA